MDLGYRYILPMPPRPRAPQYSGREQTGKQGITGILDWDSALFAPLVLSCRPPMWLWAWSDGPEDERLAGRGTTPNAGGPGG